MTHRLLPRWRSRHLQWGALFVMIAALLALPGTARADSVQCGAVLVGNITLDHDVAGCLSDGLVVGAPGITIDLNGKTISGTGLGAGIKNDGFHGVTVKNGTVQEFDYGVQLSPGTVGAVVDTLTIAKNQLAGVQLVGVKQSQILNSNIQFQSNHGIELLASSEGNTVFANTLGNNGGYGIYVHDSRANRIESNVVTISGDRGVLLESASGNGVFLNTVTHNSDGGVNLLTGSDSNIVYGNELSLNGDAAFIVTGSNGNWIERNKVDANGDAGLVVTESNGSYVLLNSFSGSSDSGIFLQMSNDSTLHGNDVRFNTGGIELTSSNNNRVQLNDASNSTGIGIELQDAHSNIILSNTANANSAQGIHVEGDTDSPSQTNLISCNMANQNLGDGIVVTSVVHTIRMNSANDNDGWGIHTAQGNLDAGGNEATGNTEAAQCYGVFCSPIPRDCPAPPPPPPPPFAFQLTSPALPAAVASTTGTAVANATPRKNATRRTAAKRAAPRCRIPKVRGRKFVEARAALVRAGCRVGTVRWRKSKLRRGRVVAQSPRAGYRVKRGFKVHLIRSKGRRASRD